MAPVDPKLLGECAEAEGFPLHGCVDLGLARDEYGAHVARYDAWLAEGNAGAMEYLKRGRDRRADPRLVFPAARSVLVVGLPYRRAPAGSLDPARGPRYARYLHGRDYHDEVAERLERALARAARTAPLTWKVCVDSSAVLERAWGAIAGLGWIGKNTMLLHPKLGSYFFLGVALLDRETGQGPKPMADLCGHCERCLRSCPTGALKAPGPVGSGLDARACISYLTLEHRGDPLPGAPDPKLLGTWVAGCDLCQEACPFNLKPARAPEPELASTQEPGAIAVDTWEALAGESEEAYRARVKGSALSRVKPGMWVRNVAVARRNGESAPGVPTP